MGTRCVIEFKDKRDSKERYCVYKHWDGDPETIFDLLVKAKERAWKLPRFESDEFAAAFVAVAKEGEGDVRLAQGHENFGDLSYWYEVFQQDGEITALAHYSPEPNTLLQSKI